MALLLAGLAVAGIVAPYGLRLERAVPSTAAALWFVSLALRALIAVATVAYVVVLAPTTALFEAVTHWCWRAVVPALQTELGMDGHRVGDAVLAAPALLLAASGASVAFGVLRAGRAVRRLLGRESLGPGPQGSVIVGGREILLLAAGFSRPRVVVSVGALTALDDAELAAGLGHERAHIVRRHRWVLVAAALLRSLGRFAGPGARSAERHLAFHLERDADAWAVRQHDRHALADVIGKAASSQAPPSAGCGPLTGGPALARRLEELTDLPAPARRLQARLLRSVAAFGAALVLGLTVLIPGAIAAAHTDHGSTSLAQRHCG